MADYDGKSMGRDTELILPPGVFAFVLDETKGHINTLCGPIKQSLSNTDRLVTFNPETKRFVPSGQQQNAIQTNMIAPKGSYVVLENPATNGKQPEPGKAEVMPIGTLRMGQIENLAGPQSFPLWPGQNATVVKGHHLRSNQYLMVRVYDDEAAKANWDKSVVKGAATEGSEPSKQNVLGINRDTLVTGQLIVIRGTDVAFYIPPTGIEVLVDEDEDFVRDAVTLERLEYSILMEENGNKEYKIGPDLVFPTPTQQFYTKNNMRKFRAFELQPTTGIHVKVIADYTDGENKYEAGNELFITGEVTPIYYPRPEHAVISYNGVEKSFAVAIPGGEGRYVLDRKTGDIDLVEGPAMFLPNPIKEVIVQRILTDSECELYYPGNPEVLRINRDLRGATDLDGGQVAAAASALTLDSIDYGSYAESAALRTRSFAPSALASAPREKSGKAAFGDEMNRGTKYTAPRKVSFPNKYDGAVRINVWSGYAVQVVNSKGDRRTVKGPTTVLLQYDQYLEPLTLSKGKPKNPDNRMNTAYLRYLSNPVSDILSLKTQDLVNVEVQVKYLVRFDEAAQDKWFSVDNYVQYMVDHLRSMIGNAVRNMGVQEFYQNAANILRVMVLGEKDAQTGLRPLKRFDENGMVVYDLELIAISVKDGEVSSLLAKSRQETLTDSIELERQKAKLTLVQGQESAKRQIAEELATTQELTDKLNAEQQERAATLRLNQAEQENAALLKRKEGEKAVTTIAAEIGATNLASEKARKDLEQTYAQAELERKISFLANEAAASKERMAAVTPGLVEALVAAAEVGILEKVTPHMAALAFVNGSDLEATLGTMLKGTAAETILDNLKGLSRVRKQLNG